MARLEVNWAKITSDIIVKVHFTFLPYGAFLANMFQKFKIDLASKSNVVKLFEPFD